MTIWSQYGPNCGNVSRLDHCPSIGLDVERSVVGMLLILGAPWGKMCCGIVIGCQEDLYSNIHHHADGTTEKDKLRSEAMMWLRMGLRRGNDGGKWGDCGWAGPSKYVLSF